MAQHKKDGACRRLIVTGCLAERYRDELQDGDSGDRRRARHRRGPRDRQRDRRRDDALGTVAARRSSSTRPEHPESPTPGIPQSPSPSTLPTYIYDADTPRLLATPRHYAYVKIAEGCDYKCAFCIIPTLRGALPEPAGRLDRPRGARAGRARRQGAAAHLAGHDLLRHRSPRARRARAPAARAERGRRPRVDPAALSLSDDDRRRDAGGDGRVREGLQVHRPAAAARVESGPEADEAARHAAELRRAARAASATASRASRSARPSSSASRARPTPTSRSCAGSSATMRSTTSACSPTPTRKARRRTSSTTTCRRRAKTARRNRVMSLQKRLVGRRQRGRIGERARVLVDGPSGDHELVAEGPAVDPGARHRRRRSISTECDPSSLPRRRFRRGRDRRRARDYDSDRAPGRRLSLRR